MRTISLIFLGAALVALNIPASAQSWLTNGLVGYYPLHGDVNDMSGAGNDAIANGALLATNRFGIASDSYSLGNGSYIRTTNSAGFPVSTSDFTVSVWLSLSAVVTIDPAMIFANRDINQFQLALNPAGGNTGFLDFWTGGNHGAPPDCRSATVGWVANHWYHLLILRTNNAVAIHRDGVLIGQSITLLGNAATIPNRNLTFGYRLPQTCCPLSGRLDDIRIYNRAFSEAEVLQLFAIESAPPLNIKKAVYLDSDYLKVGTNYQLQVTTDLNTWTNYDLPFTATNSAWRTTNYWDVDNWDKLFFRLQITP